MARRNWIAFVVGFAVGFFPAMRPAVCEPRPAHYDEAKIPAYTLPDPLQLPGEKRLTRARTWRIKQRAVILRLFESHVYGRSPAPPRSVFFYVASLDPRALDGAATRKEVTISLTGKKDGPGMSLLLYVPNEARRPVPLFLGLNFEGNHAVHPDAGISLSTRWMPGHYRGVQNNRATERSRGSESRRWPVQTILSRGYALATVYYGDIEPDRPDGWKEGVRGFWLRQSGKKEFADDDWGAIGAWAWGLSRAMDYLAKDRDLDVRRVAVMGHSRLGKSALWAGAQDERFALVISNNSGCGGAALSRRAFGETVGLIQKSFPHWFCGNFRQYTDNEAALPVDQHELIAMIAPRPVYVASADEDLWADPRGEFLAAQHAEPVYRLFRKKGLGVNAMPPPDTSIGHSIGYHIRRGKHDVTDYDWQQYLNFADKHFRRR